MCDVLCRQVMVDQLVFSPIMIGTFLVSLELLRGRGIEHVADTVRAKFLRLYLAEWTVWPPAQVFSFYCLPTRCVCSILALQPLYLTKN